jgi:hypothetical protein
MPMPELDHQDNDPTTRLWNTLAAASRRAAGQCHESTARTECKPMPQRRPDQSDVRLSHQGPYQFQRVAERCPNTACVPSNPGLSNPSTSTACPTDAGQCRRKCKHTVLVVTMRTCRLDHNPCTAQTDRGVCVCGAFTNESVWPCTERHALAEVQRADRCTEWANNTTKNTLLVLRLGPTRMQS